MEIFQKEMQKALENFKLRQKTQPNQENEQIEREFNFNLFFSYIKEFEGVELQVYKDTTNNFNHRLRSQINQKGN